MRFNREFLVSGFLLKNLEPRGGEFAFSDPLAKVAGSASLAECSSMSV
jgi:hypothetical protein